MPRGKRKSSKGETQEQRRPPPPPPPPQSLIRLLKSDKAVLKYFTSLQANLEADKAKWKNRAIQSEQRCEELQNTIECQRKLLEKKSYEDTEKEKATKRETQEPQNRKVHETVDCETKKLHQDKNEVNGMETMVKPIDDSFLANMMDELSSDDDSSSDQASVTKEDHNFPEEKRNHLSEHLALAAFESSDESNDNENSFKSLANSHSQKNSTERCNHEDNDLLSSDDDEMSTSTSSHPEDYHKQHIPSSKYSLSDQDVQTVVSEVHGIRLSEAFDHLQYLGIRLVDEEGNRRSDIDVAEDIIQSLRAISRVQLMSLPHGSKNTLLPFLKDLIPACNIKGHPAYEAVLRLFSALKIMDLYCWDMDQVTWKMITEDIEHEKREHINIGLRNRHILVTNFMESLEGEITDAWPIIDRSSRIISTALHYDSTNQQLEEINSSSGQQPQVEFGAKNHSRLSTMLERCMLVQLLTHYYDHRQQSWKRIHLLCRYIVATVPALSVEEYPRLPPVMSLCLVEAVLNQREELLPGYSTDFTTFKDFDDSELLSLEAISVAIHVAAYFWKERSKSEDDRIRDVARIQVSTYDRLLKLGHQWFTTPIVSKEDIDSRCKSLVGINESIIGIAILATISASLFANLTTSIGTQSPLSSVYEFHGRCIVMWNLELRKLERYRCQIGSASDRDELEEQWRLLSHVKDLTTPCLEEYSRHVETLAKCCVFLSAGDRATSLARFVIESILDHDYNTHVHPALQALKGLSDIPLVRFINLSRRVDRRNVFQAQAKIERLLLVDAVINFDAEVGDNFYFWGKHAFDGRDETVGNIRTKLIASCWRPSDLQAFDRDAQSKDQFVPISPSERACALSHISAWEGVRRSLELMSHKGLKSNVFEHPDHVMRLFHISGFASGKAILIENESMFPAPVCIVMEDDAILAERFVDRLHALLKELPRDFHFCSLGYSRPKTAPMIPFSTQLGIPTCIWYLTGYILSLEGVNFLQQKLPVQGPIDSWIGLRMCANFENDYGQEIGVGSITSKPLVKPSQEDLRQILKFRAFAAVSPLCSQKVQNAKTNTKTERHGWRHRDTDIEYSGV